MKRLLWAIWLLAPVAAAAYHYGPGQALLPIDHAASLAREGEELAAAALAQGDCDEARAGWRAALERFEQSLSLLPPEHAAAQRRLRLEAGKAKTHIGELLVAEGELAALVDELVRDPAADAALVDDARGALAGAQYYATWLRRLEGKTREEWEPAIENARQNYRLLAEQARAARATTLAAQHERDLESAIRLERMELEDLQGLPLPSQ